MKNFPFASVLGCLIFSACHLTDTAAVAQDTDAKSAWPIYINVFGGFSHLDRLNTVNSPNGIDMFDISLDTNDGFLWGGAVGVNVSDAIRVEIEASHAGWDAKHIYISFPGVFKVDDAATGKMNATYLLVNTWVDWNNESPFTPYAGGGLGIGWANGNTLWFSDQGYDDGEIGFAFQLGAGLKYDISDYVSFDLGYRFKGIADIDFQNTNPATAPFEGGDLYSNNVQLGLTYRF